VPERHVIDVCDHLKAIRDRVRALCLGFPEATEQPGDHPHNVYQVRKRTFAYFLVDHYGDGEIALVAKVSPGRNDHLIESSPQRYFMPAYVGPKGWVAMRLDGPGISWDEAADLVEESYALIAPATLVRRLKCDN
jgi:hypothetical protein